MGRGVGQGREGKEGSWGQGIGQSKSNARQGRASEMVAAAVSVAGDGSSNSAGPEAL